MLSASKWRTDTVNGSEACGKKKVSNGHALSNTSVSDGALEKREKIEQYISVLMVLCIFVALIVAR